jgi:hypothetical protein
VLAKRAAAGVTEEDRIIKMTKQNQMIGVYRLDEPIG